MRWRRRYELRAEAGKSFQGLFTQMHLSVPLQREGCSCLVLIRTIFPTEGSFTLPQGEVGFIHLLFLSPKILKLTRYYVLR